MNKRQPKKYKGKIRLTRIITDTGNNYGCIELEDLKFKRIVTINLSIKEAGELFLSRGYVDCEYNKYYREEIHHKRIKYLKKVIHQN